mgnify:FL=1
MFINYYYSRNIVWRFWLLPFHLIQFVHLDAADVTVDVNHDGNGYSRFGRRDGDGE